MAKKYKASLISKETFFQAMTINLRNEYSSTSQIRNVIGSPDGYDVGGRLFAFVQSGYVKKKKDPNGGGNVYRVTSKGKKLLLVNPKNVQAFGSYTSATENTAAAVLGSTYSVAADAAMSELAGIIEKNARLKNTIIGIVNQIDMALGEV